LEGALNQYFREVGYRNLQEVVDLIKEDGMTWATKPKALWLEI